MTTQVPQRELRNHTAEVLRRAEQGERVEITVNGRPVAELGPLSEQATWVPGEEIVRELRGLLDPDDPLAEELREADTPARDPFE